jgi:hypothetical protein
MKVRPKGPGESSHNYDLKPTKQIFKRPSQVGTNALMNARYVPKKFGAESKIPDAKVAKRTTRAAFEVFSKANKR